MTTTANGRTGPRLSRAEEKVYDLLPASGERTDTRELARKFYRGSVPINGQTIVNGITRRLELKTRRHRPRVRRGVRHGPHPMAVWLEV